MTALLCCVLLLGIVYLLQTGDLIKKTFVLGASQAKMASIEKQLAPNNSQTAPALLSLNQIEELAAHSGFVPVGQVLYVPLSAGATQLVVSNIR